MNLNINGAAIELCKGNNYLLITDYDSVSLATLNAAIDKCKELDITLISIRTRHNIDAVRICGPIAPENINCNGESE